MSEAARILRPGGGYVIHELAMRPDTIPEEPATEIRRALLEADVALPVVRALLADGAGILSTHLPHTPL